MFNINRYNNKQFSKNLFIDKRIKAVFLLYDKFTHESKLNYFQRQRLINIWISKFIRYEEYELAEAFKQRKIRQWKKWRKVHRLGSIKLFWRVWRLRIHKIKNKLFN